MSIRKISLRAIRWLLLRSGTMIGLEAMTELKNITITQDIFKN